MNNKKSWGAKGKDIQRIVALFFILVLRDTNLE